MASKKTILTRVKKTDLDFVKRELGLSSSEGFGLGIRALRNVGIPTMLEIERTLNGIKKKNKRK